ncbi:MAG: GNAT family N-acetyltransferase [Rhodobacteraceae bacterium]|nr:GNAT family N-acetyltransferase [Paracoccaceae bacterium]
MMVELTVTNDLDRCLCLRYEVFVIEQGVPIDRERDEMDATAIHILATTTDRDLGTARIFVSGETARIGRVCVVADARGTGLGTSLIRKALDIAGDMPGLRQVRLGAQTHALAFYEKLGFVAEGPIYDDAGIPHRDMVQPL